MAFCQRVDAAETEVDQFSRPDDGIYMKNMNVKFLLKILTFVLIAWLFFMPEEFYSADKYATEFHGRLRVENGHKRSYLRIGDQTLNCANLFIGPTSSCPHTFDVMKNLHQNCVAEFLEVTTKIFTKKYLLISLKCGIEMKPVYTREFLAEFRDGYNFVMTRISSCFYFVLFVFFFRKEILQALKWVDQHLK